MAQYQVRVWRGWYHHMALVCLAMWFVLREKLRSSASVPPLSYRDLTELLDYYLPRRSYSEEEVKRQIQKTPPETATRPGSKAEIPNLTK